LQSEAQNKIDLHFAGLAALEQQLAPEELADYLTLLAPRRALLQLG